MISFELAKPTPKEQLLPEYGLETETTRSTFGKAGTATKSTEDVETIPSFSADHTLLPLVHPH